MIILCVLTLKLLNTAACVKNHCEGVQCGSHLPRNFTGAFVSRLSADEGWEGHSETSERLFFTGRVATTN